MTDHKQKSARAVAWNLAGTFGKVGVKFLISALLARLLSPADFGLFGMLLVFTTLGTVMVEGGFGLALVHSKNATRTEETSVLICNVAIGICMYGVLWAAAPLVAAFFRQDALIL